MIEFFVGLSPTLQALCATLFTYGVTMLGAAIVFFFKEVKKGIMDGLLGFSAGVMIAASFWSLLSPAIEMADSMQMNSWLIVFLGFFAGGILLFIGDKISDFLLRKKDCTNQYSSKIKRCLMLVFSITLHNIPEGMAIGVAFGGIASGVPGMTVIGAVMLAIGIGIQNFPEGAAVSLPLRSEGFSRYKSFMIGQASALVEPISAVIGAILVMYIRSMMPFLLAFAAGAMLIVAARELLPESVKEHKNLSTLGLVFGFVLMMILDVTLG